MKKKDPKKTGSKIENEHLAAILCYLIVGVIWFFVDEKMKKSEFVKFHTKQAINLWIIQIVLSTAMNIMWVITWSFGWIVSLIIFVLWIMGLINAANRKQKEIPIIGQFAEKYLTY